MEIHYQPIGRIRSPFYDLADMPVQPTSRVSAPGKAEIYPAYQAGLKDLEGFSHVILLYHLHKVRKTELLVTPFLDDEPRGVFATRAPTRPNPIGLSIVRIVGIKAGVIDLEQVDTLDGTPLLDLKPYVPEFDQPSDVRVGWLAAAKRSVTDQVSDDRFV